ncbi:hypothetical protein EIN_418260 [Entamoeba invadens IP1]|uniref:Uncharacterized protein n=1 Tax=Entamoeba invadens IP1 TaxID=370355 RepID=A0A0A1U513_ENTIV|nr:hypothetical protein EIN_418260 [Entamoeba invadens IP1]ELP87967.1 hypothetical protein EIN_418260 [Entamoeba invadens IP1]|eukprot:XP_004254738.1 hypothetical protein EIN_418260 [Entamoeba invadens IP1]
MVNNVLIVHEDSHTQITRIEPSNDAPQIDQHDEEQANVHTSQTKDDLHAQQHSVFVIKHKRKMSDKLNTSVEDFKSGIFVHYKSVGIGNVNLNKALEDIREYTFYKGKFDFENYKILIDYLFENESEQQTENMNVIKRSIVEYLINSLSIEAGLSESQINAVRFGQYLKFYLLSRQYFDDIKSLSLSQRSVGRQIKRANVYSFGDFADCMGNCGCICIATDSTTKKHKEIYCVILRYELNGDFYSVPLILKEYEEKKTNSESVAKWLLDELLLLGIPLNKLHCITTDGCATMCGVDRDVVEQFNVQLGLLTAKTRVPYPSIKGWWCSTHRFHLVGESCDTEPEVKMIE